MIKTIFTDVGGVLLTNGWGSGSRKRAAEKFGLDFADMDSRHHLTFDTYEVGKTSLEEYLNRVVFWKPRDFTMDQFREFMFGESKPFPEMLDLMRKLKANGYKVVVISNEGRELTEHRIRTFQMGEFVDFFVSSCFVHFRKPDRDIFKMAIDLAQADPAESVYLDDRSMFVEVASTVGLQAIRHTDLESTTQALTALGVRVL